VKCCETGSHPVRTPDKKKTETYVGVKSFLVPLIKPISTRGICNTGEQATTLLKTAFYKNIYSYLYKYYLKRVRLDT